MTTQVYRVYIKATPQAIWDAITKPEWTETLRLPGTLEYDLRPGGAFRIRSRATRCGRWAWPSGSSTARSSRPTRRAGSSRPGASCWDEQIAAEGPTRLTYEIEEGPGGVSKLTVTHELENAPTTAAYLAGEIADAGGGWSWVLSDLKSLLETGAPLPG